MFPNTTFVPPQNFVRPMRHTCTNPRPAAPPYRNTRLNPPMPMPVPIPQSLSPPPINRSPPPDSPPSDLIDRMRQVQMLMMEINRLQSASGERNSQRIQELQQRVVELSDTDGQAVPLPQAMVDPRIPPPHPRTPPPAYLPVDNGNRERPEYSDGRG